MDFQATIQRATSILKDPKGVWGSIRLEQPDPKSLLLNYFLPLAALAQLANIIKMSIIGISAGPFGTYRISFVSAVGHGIVQLILSVVFLYIFAFLLNTLAPKFGGQTTKEHCMALVAYSYTAGFAGAVLTLVPFVGFLLALAGGIYGLYTMYQGVPAMTSVPEAQRSKYLAVSVICMIIIGAILSAVIVPSMTPPVGRIETASGSLSTEDLGNFAKDMDTVVKNLNAQAGR